MADDTPSAAAPTTSPMVIGRYVLFDRIAAGGMASVHLGRLVGPVGFSRTVAIKRMHPHVTGDPDMVRMFIDEARLAGRIQHPNVVQVLDVVVRNAELFLVMDYVHGEPVSSLLRQQRKRGDPMPLRVASAVLLGVLHGLHAAHEARSETGEPLDLVHRDVSPQNILVGLDGVPRVSDFGIAKAAGRLQTTHDGQLKGKAAYMAPEQVLDAPIDRRVDLYAAAVVLWEMLTGRRMFEGDNPLNTIRMVLEKAPVPPSQHAPHVPPEVDAIVMCGLAHDAANRFASAREMALALETTVPPATAREVGEWVERLAGAQLSARAARVAEIERESTGGVPSPSARELTGGTSDVATAVATVVEGAPGGTDVSSLSVSTSGRGPAMRLGSRRRVAASIGAVGVLVAAATFAAWLRRGPPASAASTQIGTTAATGAASAPVVDVADSAAASIGAPSAQPSASVAPASASASASASATVASSGPRPSRPAGKGAPSRPAGPATAGVGCRDPFTWAPDGTKIPKPECFTR